MRRFLETNFIVLAIVAVQPVFASAYNETFDAQFSDGQKRFLYTAIEKAYNGLFNSGGIYNCIYKQARYEPLDEASVTRLYGEQWLRTGKMFLIQRGVFGAFIAQNVNLPDITILYANDPKTFAGGWAHYGKVHTSKDARGLLHWHGNFEVTINAAKLQGRQSYESWAGLIAHEMLHNLMHSHPDPNVVGLDKAYTSDYLINAVQSCVQTAGTSSANAHDYRCGGRQP